MSLLCAGSLDSPFIFNISDEQLELLITYLNNNEEIDSVRVKIADEHIHRPVVVCPYCAAEFLFVLAMRNIEFPLFPTFHVLPHYAPADTGQYLSNLKYNLAAKERQEFIKEKKERYNLHGK